MLLKVLIIIVAFIVIVSVVFVASLRSRVGRLSSKFFFIYIGKFIPALIINRYQVLAANSSSYNFYCRLYLSFHLVKHIYSRLDVASLT